MERQRHGRFEYGRGGVYRLSEDGALGGLTLAFRASTASGASGIQLLSPEELWNLDTKLDDGKPGYGIVIGPKNSWITPACTTTDVSATSVYDFSNTTKTCRFDYQIMVY